MKKKMYLCFAETSHPYEAFVVINGHNSRNNWAINSDMAAVINKLEKNIGIIEQLSDNKISTGINLSHIQKNQNKRKHKYTPRRNHKPTHCYHLIHIEKSITIRFRVRKS